MIEKNTIFSPAEILLPAFADDSVKMQKWAVIACDQFTSDMGYWKKCAQFIGEAPSAYRYILPEAYLDRGIGDDHNAVIRKSMDEFDASSMLSLNGYIYLERTLPNGMIRRGIIGKIDLESYDYTAASSSPVRATEATVLERIPPRCAIREAAVIELPHILILIDDRIGVLEQASALAENTSPVYDFDLMQGGGHVRGFALSGEKASAMTQKIAEYEENAGTLVYAMGDGNHSLAAAKALWEKRKAAGADMDDPARYALCEITPLSDDSLVFEPIYRLVKFCDPDHLRSELLKVAEPGDGEQSFTYVTSGGEEKFHFTEKTHALTVGTLQNFIDAYIEAEKNRGVNPDMGRSPECDYIHGEDTLRSMAQREIFAGFLLDGMDKNELFPYVEAHGTLPRKTFSMGEAESKRYYLEARVIKK